MAETGKLGISDSLLANVQLAFAAADPTPPAITTQGGQLGGELGDTILALAGAEGSLTFNVSAESALVLAQTADPAPVIAPHASPDWVLGGHDSQLGGMELAYDGAPAALPTPTTHSGLLGTALGDAVLGLDGAAGPRVFALSATSALAITQTADSGAVIVPHTSPRWVLGGQDSSLGGVELAFAGEPDPRPLTGSLTGTLGTTNSLLGGVRLALGLEEGEGTGGIIYADAESDLSLTGAAAAALARPMSATSALSLSVAADRNNLLSASAGSTISLVVAAGRNNLRETNAESALSLDTAAATTVAWAAAATSAIGLTDDAGRNSFPTASAESAISVSSAASFAAVRVLSAESVLSLTDAAANTGRTIYTVSAGSALDLTDEAGFTAARAVGAESVLDLTGAAGRNNLLSAVAESALALAGAAGGFNFPLVTAESTISLTSAAARNGFLHLLFVEFAHSYHGLLFREAGRRCPPDRIAPRPSPA